MAKGVAAALISVYIRRKLFNRGEILAFYFFTMENPDFVKFSRKIQADFFRVYDKKPRVKNNNCF